MSLNRKLQYSLAINEAITQSMEKDRDVLVMGQGLKSPWYAGRTAEGLIDRFGKKRVIDTPVSENAITGAGVGTALTGMKTIVMYPRMDFMLYAMDPIINEAANWRYMNGGRTSVPVVFWGVINRGGEQAAQHSQAIQALFAHIPGLKVVAPSNAYDAKGLMIASIEEDNPVVFIDERWLYNIEGEVPEEMYTIPIGKGEVKKKGTDITLVSYSYMMTESLKAAQELEEQGISVEVVDLRTIKPIDKELILESVKKTGRLIIVDGSWKFCGVSSEISAIVSENALDSLKSPIKRLTLPDCPTPASSNLEKEYYIDKDDIIEEIKKII